MEFEKPIFDYYENGEHMFTNFDRFQKAGIEFLLLIDSKQELTHGMLKLLEARCKMITQQVTLEKVLEIVDKGKPATLSNIVKKTNCKNFGLCYEPVMEQSAACFDLKENLVIGYDVSHPPPANPSERRLLKLNNLTVDCVDPSVVGICANMASNANNFVGDYFYQESRRENVDVFQLAYRTTWILMMLEKHRPAAARPKQIFILRDGLSEGQFSMAVQEELKAIRDGCREYDPAYQPKFCFVIGTKRHFKKFFALNAQGAVENLEPGSVIGSKVVRVDCPEFYMQSHCPLKGVGKPVQYCVPFDEIGVTQDQLQGLLNGLCYSHQIVNSAVSLPEPIFQADELAKRGRENYATMKHNFPGEVPKLQNGLVDAHRLTEQLSYMNSTLCATRFTA